MEKVQQVQAQALEEIKACEDLQQLQRIQGDDAGEERPNSVANDDDEGSFPGRKTGFRSGSQRVRKPLPPRLKQKWGVLEKAAMNRKLEEKIDITLPGVPFFAQPSADADQPGNRRSVHRHRLRRRRRSGSRTRFLQLRTRQHPGRSPCPRYAGYVLHQSEGAAAHAYHQAIQMRELEKAHGQLPAQGHLPG